MKLDSKIPKIIKDAKTKNWLHVFFVNNPVTSMIARMIIEKYKIDKNRIKVVSFRNTDTSIINFSTYYLTRDKYDSYREKILWDSPSGRKILKEINNNKFILYASWAYREVEKLINSNLCKGHLYIEEGQHSYMKIKPFEHSKISLKDRIKINWNNRFSETDEIGYYFRDDAKAFIGLDDAAFPKVSQDKKYILKNLNDLKKHYSPKLIGIKKIGLTCAVRRLRNDQWVLMLKKLFKEMPQGGVIKPHPSFISSKKSKNDFEVLFNKNKCKGITLCPNNVILELEMLYEKKTLIGSQTSLSRYSDILGSTFIDIELY